MATRIASAARAGLVLAAALLALSGCAPEPGEGPASSAPSASTSADSASASPSPTPTTTPIALPSDCRAILSDAVLAQLGTTPLNDPAYGAAVGTQPDGSLVCLWRDPAADTTGLETTISRMDRGPALDMLNALVADNGFSCFTPNGGTRCEKTWPNTQYPVTDGRTLFFRDDVLVDTRYSGLAPSGYTDSIVEKLFSS